MPKGHYLPELLTIQTYAVTSAEMLDYCVKHFDKISEALGMRASGQAPDPVYPNLGGPAVDVTRAIAFGSVVHEYVHHLQCTTRMLGCLFFECRHQQTVWTQRCMAELRDTGASPSLPLLQQANPSIPHSDAIAKWMDGWLPYQATILMTGLGSPSEAERRYQDAFNRDWFRTGNQQQQSSTDELLMEPVLEAEAQVVATAVLAHSFPDVWEGACAEFEENDLLQECRRKGVHRFIPLLSDYCMQLPLVLNKEPVCHRRVFNAALDVVHDRYAGMGHNEIFAHANGIRATIANTLKLPDLPGLLAEAPSLLSKGAVADTPLGILLHRAMQYRQRNNVLFACIPAFVTCIMNSFPIPTIYAFNSSRNKDRGNEWTMIGELDSKTAPVLYQMQTMWAARQFALQTGEVFCPHCCLNALREHCTGECGFVDTCCSHFGYNPFTKKWASL